MRSSPPSPSTTTGTCDATSPLGAFVTSAAKSNCRRNSAMTSAFSIRNGAGTYTSEILPEITRAVRLLESERTMRGHADAVVERRVGAELGAPLRSRPRFRGRNQLATDAASACGRHDIPSFEIPDVAGGAPVDHVADRELGESDRGSAVECDEHFGRLTPIALEESIDVGTMCVRVVRPERASHLEPRAGVRRRHRTYGGPRTDAPHHSSLHYSTRVCAN